eukprot:1158867-Pelagomonas_calceolata.AAC.26
MTNEPPAGLKHNMRRCLALEPLNDPAIWEEPAAVQEEPPPASRAKKRLAVTGRECHHGGCLRDAGCSCMRASVASYNCKTTARLIPRVATVEGVVMGPGIA